MKTIFNYLKELPNMHFQPPTNEEDIYEWEKKYIIKLPADYKSWLLLSDGGEIFIPGIQFYGICQRPVLHQNILNDQNDNLPTDLFVIGVFSFGDLLCFVKDEDTIIQWDHENWNEYMKWDNFLSFLTEMKELFADEEKT